MKKRTKKTTFRLTAFVLTLLLLLSSFPTVFAEEVSGGVAEGITSGTTYITDEGEHIYGDCECA